MVASSVAIGDVVAAEADDLVAALTGRAVNHVVVWQLVPERFLAPDKVGLLRGVVVAAAPAYEGLRGQDEGRQRLFPPLLRLWGLVEPEVLWIVTPNPDWAGPRMMIQQGYDDDGVGGRHDSREHLQQQ